MTVTITCARCQRPKALNAFAVWADGGRGVKLRLTVQRDDTCRKCRGAMYRKPDMIVRHRTREMMLLRQLETVRRKIDTLLALEESA